MATELVSFVYTTDVMAKAVVIGRSNWILMVAYQALGACVGDLMTKKITGGHVLE